MSKDLILSVVVPVYNSEKYLKQCIESILSQTINNNISIILVDDGSTDNSGKICDAYAENNKNILVIHKINGGRVSARKTGLCKVTTKYVGFVDADDWIEPEMYETMTKLMIAKNVDMVDCAYNLYDDSLHKIVKVVKDNLELGKNVQGKKLIQKFVNGDIIQSHGTRIYKTSILKECMESVPDYITLGEDGICNFRYICAINDMYVTDCAYYNYRKHEAATTQGKNENYLREVNDFYKVYLAEIKASGYNQELLGLFENKIVNLILESVNRLGLMHPYDIMRYRVNAKEIKGERVVVYGAGKVGRDIYNQLCCDSHIQVVLWTDKNWVKLKQQYPKVESLDKMNNCCFDTILIAVKDYTVAEEIKTNLKDKYGISSEKMIWIYPETCIMGLKELGTNLDS